MERLLQYRPRRLIDFWKAEDNKILCGTVGGTYQLDEIASFVFERCDGHHTVEEIIDELARCTQMQAQKQLVQRDVSRLLESWRAERLIILNFNPLHAAGEYDAEALYDLGVTAQETVDILLITPPSPNPATGMNLKVHSTFPLGIATLSAVLKEHGYRVAQANLWLRQANRRSLERLLQMTRPRVLGVSTMTDNFPNGVTIARIAREVLPEIKVVFGGPHVTPADAETLAEHPEIDVVVRNEGEATLLELMEHYVRGAGELERIRGITYRRGDAIRRNPARALIKNLDELPLPDRGEINLNVGMIGLQTSRGCPGRCIFCVAGAMAGGMFRNHSAERVLDELLYLYRQGARRFFFQDDTITADVPRLHAILGLIKRFGLQMEWSAESRVDVIDQDPEIFAKMAGAGCTWVQFGVEAGAQDVLDNLQKRIEVDQIYRAISAARAAGLKAVCTMLMGHPFDTPATIRTSVAFAESLIERGAYVLFSIVVPYPGTKLQKQAEHFGLVIHPADYSDYYVSNAIMDTPNMTRQQIRCHYYDAMRTLLQRYAAMEEHFG